MFSCSVLSVPVLGLRSSPWSQVGNLLSVAQKKMLDSGICSDLCQCTHLADEEMEVQKI